ncbi:hypothetical protein VTL71DRAFT_3185 [Oculimacula yallundae]|uniref:2EXR domain-containing protein n=1 Tax=Oculimacula yallundae TaxID=86028 RepID=A0ABR4C740_9HELO
MARGGISKNELRGLENDGQPPPPPKEPTLSPSPSTPSIQVPPLVECLTSFSLFSRLPEALRKMIWTTAIPQRVVVLHYDAKNKEFFTEEPNIALLSVSKEARECALQIVLPSFSSPDSSRIMYTDVEQDKIFLDAGRDGDLRRAILQWHGNITPQHFRKIERLDIGIYENRKESTLACITILGKTFLLDQANMGVRFTQVRFLAHTPFSCDLKRHTAQMFTVDCEDQVTVCWEDDIVNKVREVNESMLEIARSCWGLDGNETYAEGVEGPIRLEFENGFCGLQGVTL